MSLSQRLKYEKVNHFNYLVILNINTLTVIVHIHSSKPFHKCLVVNQAHQYKNRVPCVCVYRSIIDRACELRGFHAAVIYWTFCF